MLRYQQPEMTAIKIFLNEMVFLAITVLEKSIAAKIWDTSLCKTSLNVQKNVSRSKIDFESFLRLGHRTAGPLISCLNGIVTMMTL